MTRISLRNIDLENIPIILDGCCGTAGFLIETMAYMTGRIRNDSRYNERDRIKKIEHICNDCLFGIEANKRTSRIARINMYLHGDGGSHIFHGDGLEESPKPTIDMTDEEQSETIDHAETVKNELFDIILSNPPFSMNYQRSKEEDKHIIDQFDFTIGQNSVKSSVLFLNRYEKLLKKGGEMLIVLDDTILNGKSYEDLRKWLLERFVLLGIHSLPFNTFLKAKANIKTSILHLRKKIDEDGRNGEYAGIPIATPSANITGRPSGTNIKQIQKDFEGKVDYFIDNGESALGVPSTIIKIVNNKIHILRQGTITEKEILSIL